MAIELVKRGQGVSLEKKDPELKKLLLNAFWGKNRYNGQYDFDVDITVFAVDEFEKCKDDKDMVFYNENYLTHPSGAIMHSPDDREGSDDPNAVSEYITIDLDKVPARITKLVGVATIYEGKDRKQHFGMVPNARLELINQDTKNPLYRYDLTEDFGTNTAAKIFEVYRHNGNWKFKGFADGYEYGLAEFVEQYGLSVKGERK